jgi:hypothetical protein
MLNFEAYHRVKKARSEREKKRGHVGGWGGEGGGGDGKLSNVSCVVRITNNFNVRGLNVHCKQFLLLPGQAGFTLF